MMLAIWTTIVLIVVAIAVAMTLGFRRYTAAPVREEQEICGTTCYPAVRRDGRKG